MCHVSVQNPSFYRLLLRIDHDLAQRTRAQRCRCGGVLHSARYPRKPRGLPREAASDCDFRYSFCCAQCRHRTTPFSVRFLGRRVYVAAIMVAVSAARASAGTAAAMRQLDALGNMGLMSRFVGMLTDSRSFLSYPRHDYFRRILCNLLGGEMEQGLIPHDFEHIGGIVRAICCENARSYFRFPVKVARR